MAATPTRIYGPALPRPSLRRRCGRLASPIGVRGGARCPDAGGAAHGGQLEIGLVHVVLACAHAPLPQLVREREAHAHRIYFLQGTFASKGCIICLELITGLAITRGKKLLKLNALRSSQMLMRKMQNLPICTINYIFGKYGFASISYKSRLYQCKIEG